MNRLFAILILSIFSFSASAERNIYGVLSAGYAQNEIDDFEFDKSSYKLGIGYELSRQWYIEAGFQSLGEQNAGEQFEQINDDVVEIAGLYLSALGKARGQYGELFYRLGVMRADAEVQSVANLSCANSPETAIENNVCRIDDSLMAGVFGLGFDVFIHHSTMVRFEVEHIRGEQDFAASAAYIGIRLNF